MSYWPYGLFEQNEASLQYNTDIPQSCNLI